MATSHTIEALGVTQYPARQTDTLVCCVICHSRVPLSVVTTGSYYADGSQAFACREHTWNKTAWLVSWVRFTAQQEQHKARHMERV